MINYQASIDFNLLLQGAILGGLVMLVIAVLLRRLTAARWKTEDALRRRNQELAALNAITATLTATLELDQVLQRLVNTVDELFPQATAATLQLLHERDGTLRTTAASSGVVPVPQKVVFRPGQGVAGLALDTHRPVNVADVTADPRYLLGAVPPSYRSLLVAPLVIGDRVWGTLSVEGDAVGAFQERDEQLIALLAQQATIAVENAQLYQETRRRLTEVRALAEASTHLTAQLEPQATMVAVVEQAQVVLGADRAVVYLFDRPEERLAWLYASGLSDEYLDQVRRLYRDLPGYQALVGQPLWVDEAQADGAVGLLQELARREGYHSFVVLPLSHHARVVGGLVLYFDQRHARNQALLDLGQAFANQAVVALENARLFDRVRTAETQYRAFFEGSTNLIAVTDTEGILLAVNPVACEVWGQTREELLGQSIAIVSDQDAATIHQAIERALDNEILHYEFSFDIDGKTHHFSVRLERIDYAGDVALQWVARDVTARRELDRWREELTGIIIHNLRNPLTWIKSGTEIARMFLPDDMDADIVLALDKAIKGTARLEQRIDVLLNTNRAEAGQELTDQEPLAPATLIAEVIELLSPRAATQKVQLQARLPESLPMVSGNRNMLAWTLENLIENAIKFSSQGGAVTIRADRVDPSALRISVIDRGYGVSSSEREHIFQKFYQVRRSEGRPSYGMGLYFCKLAIEAHGGRIWVEDNDQGPGSTFAFTLPL